MNNESSRVDLGKYLWKNRLVLIFAASADDSLYRKQIDEFEGEIDGLVDRDVIVMELLDTGQTALARPRFNHGQQSLLRAEFEVPADAFELVLIGKDGTVKLKSEETVSAADLFVLIDSMPMRKDEMRMKANKLQIQE
ncbi:MAG: DUF4174 domain-containing protein [Planctomycetota bacterium]